MRKVKGRWASFVVQDMRTNTIRLVQAKIHNLYRRNDAKGTHVADVELEWARLTLRYPHIAKADLELIGALQPSCVSLDKGQCLWIEQFVVPEVERDKILNEATKAKELVLNTIQ